VFDDPSDTPTILTAAPLKPTLRCLRELTQDHMDGRQPKTRTHADGKESGRGRSHRSNEISFEQCKITGPAKSGEHPSGFLLGTIFRNKIFSLGFTSLDSHPTELTFVPKPQNRRCMI
jgi:hypothetical protein